MTVIKTRSMVTALSVLFVCLGTVTDSADGQNRKYVSIVGSSTVFPFSTTVAERYGGASDDATPKVESTGTGGGFKLFCSGLGLASPDIANASRRIKVSEFEECMRNGVTDILEVPIGFDGIVLATGRGGPRLDLITRDIYLALAKTIPSPSGDFVANPNQLWADANPLLPETPIHVTGPSPVHGTREAFEDLAMVKGCSSIDTVLELEKTDRPRYEEVCREVREDGRFVPIAGSYNLIVEKLRADPDLVGIVGLNFLDENRNTLSAIPVDGVEPTFEAITDGDYPIARSVYFYVKIQHMDVVPGLTGYVDMFLSDAASGEDGYLEDRGLIPLSPALRAAVKKRAADREKLTVDDLL